MFAMKLWALAIVPFSVHAASFFAYFSKHAELDTSGGAVSKEDIADCEKQVGEYMEKPMNKNMAIESAMDHCAVSKKIDDKNFVCPHFKEVLTNAFARESTEKFYTVGAFCDIAETYVYSLKHGAANIPYVAGSGKGKDFEVSEDCESVIAKSLKPHVSLPSKSAPDFWYALCMNQDCAHFLPSRTRWCHKDGQPEHSAAVCEAIRTYTQDEGTVVGDRKMGPKDLCKIYDEFVEDSHINVDAYMHVMHGKKKHAVPSPKDPLRALASASMKNEAGAHDIRDNSGDPVKNAAASTGLLLSVVGFAGFL